MSAWHRFAFTLSDFFLGGKACHWTWESVTSAWHNIYTITTDLDLQINQQQSRATKLQKAEKVQTKQIKTKSVA